MNNLNLKNRTTQIGFGLTGAAIILTYSLCAVSSIGQGLVGVLLCGIVCGILSLKTKNSVFSPDIFLLVPLFFIFFNTTPLASMISIASGGILFILFKKLGRKIVLPHCVIVGGALGLALAGTILLTNTYFGIGASGATPLEMLKSYRSLGFHPHFMGLLTGTITLFTMITYPFKFRKLNKYLPAEFITILIPFILNLFLNPYKNLTTINETVFFTPVSVDSFKDFFSFSDFSTDSVPFIIKSAFAFALILLGCSRNDAKPDTGIANIFTGALSGIPVRKHPVKEYGELSCITSVIVILLVIFLFPHALSRIPMHSIGATLIVAGWQTVPYKLFANVLKKKSVCEFIILLVCAVSFVVADVFTACLICLIASVICTRGKGCE